MEESRNISVLERALMKSLRPSFPVLAPGSGPTVVFGPWPAPPRGPRRPVF